MATMPTGDSLACKAFDREMYMFSDFAATLLFGRTIQAENDDTGHSFSCAAFKSCFEIPLIGRKDHHATHIVQTESLPFHISHDADMSWLVASRSRDSEVYELFRPILMQTPLRLSSLLVNRLSFGLLQFL